MTRDFSPGTRIELDSVGRYYTLVSSPENPGTFGATAHLRETVDPAVLQSAVNGIMLRLPFLNVRIRRGFIWYYHEVMAEPPRILPATDYPLPCSYFEKDKGHVLRILYGEKHFTMEVLHSICDGRSLMKIIAAVVIRYFELLGVEFDKTGIIDSGEEVRAEEAEDAYARFADYKKTVSLMEKTGYALDYSRPATARTLCHKFDAGKIRTAAKTYGLTISEYILSHIFMAVDKERTERKGNKPISIMLPIDCRGFYHSESLRNFVTFTTITISKTGDMAETARQIREQFAAINADSVMGTINSQQKLIKLGRFIPCGLKTFGLRIADKLGFGGNGLSTTFSNIGLVKLPKEIEERVDMMEFTLCPEPRTPYAFGCVTVGNALALTATVTVEGEEFFRDLVEEIEVDFE